MKVKTSIKAGALTGNHNETVVRDTAKGLKVKTNVKAGGRPIPSNHNETLVRQAAKGLRVRTSVKAGGILNHNETLVS
jgi:hypothetical protein